MSRRTAGKTRARSHRKTKVIATIGPACDSLETIRAMIHAGMNVARLNFSHGTHEEHRKRIQVIRQVCEEESANIAIMLDTKGVEIRTGRVAGGKAVLTTGASFDLYEDDRLGDASGVSISTARLGEGVTTGSAILLDDGVIELRVTSVEPGVIHTKIARGGLLEDRKGVNLPGSSLPHGGISAEERDDLLFAIEHDIDYIAASFVRNRADIIEIRTILEERGAHIPVIAKIENEDAVRNLEEIVTAADGTMVARGDLGVEIPLKKVPIVQKKIIRTTVMNGRPVITATQMLDSMQRNPTPTRAEVSDVANAIFDGTSAVMLSGETAAGAYPVEAVRTMASLALEAESSLDEYGHLQHTISEPAHAVTEATSQAAITMASHLDAAAIVTLTESGFTSRAISKLRPSCPILAVSVWPQVVRRLAMNWGVTAMLFEGERSDEAMIDHAIRRGRELGYILPGDVIVATTGVSQESGSTNLLRVIETDD